MVSGLQEAVNLFENVCTRFCLVTNVMKWKILGIRRLQPISLDISYIKLRGTIVETIEAFSYLYIYLSNNCTIQKEIGNRISAAHTAFGGSSK